MYSRKLQTLDFRNTEAALRALLKQLNIVQDESGLTLTGLKTQNAALSEENKVLRAELNALGDRVKTLEEGK